MKNGILILILIMVILWLFLIIAAGILSIDWHPIEEGQSVVIEGVMITYVGEGVPPGSIFKGGSGEGGWGDNTFRTFQVSGAEGWPEIGSYLVSISSREGSGQLYLKEKGRTLHMRWDDQSIEVGLE